jgi:hypothetical protein
MVLFCEIFLTYSRELYADEINGCCLEDPIGQQVTAIANMTAVFCRQTVKYCKGLAEEIVRVNFLTKLRVYIRVQMPNAGRI